MPIARSFSLFAETQCRVYDVERSGMLNFLSSYLLHIQTSMLLSVVYREHRDDDGFLYCTYAGESTFGDDTGDV